ncbi:hypothetical protein N4T77_18465 [Clostridium sp. CX1]|nr:hypothetical protein [Clostridium sp. CX1]MCT8978577.1 hypothetical protein [Clostridium sp. CX1]
MKESIPDYTKKVEAENLYFYAVIYAPIYSYVINTEELNGDEKLY